MLSPVEEIKNRIDLVELIKGYIKLDKAGVNYKALCPFHQEKNPSFIVSPEKQIWHCFSCGKGGDAFKFIMEIEGLSFREALQMLAKKTGVELKKEDPKLQSQRQVLFKINEAAAEIFEKNLFSSKGNQALQYLKKRGLRQETIRDFHLGYTFDNWHDLKESLLQKGFREDDLIASGLIIQPSKEQKATSSYNRFRGRIMFPLNSLSNNIVGFSGRVFPEPQDQEKMAAKYVNSPNTLIYNKSRTLYGLTHARQAIHKLKFIILVEGNLDVLMSHQAGIKNAVATCGTALNENHLNILKRYSKRLKICFDQDEAGVKATQEAIKKALSMGMSIKILSFDKEKDPADLILASPKKWQKIARQGKEFVEYSFDRALKKFSLKDAAGKKDIAKKLLPLIKSLSNKIEQGHWIAQLAETLSVEEKYLYEALSETKSVIQSQPAKQYESTENQNQKNAQLKTRRDLLEENLLIIFLKYPSLFSKHLKIKEKIHNKLLKKGFRTIAAKNKKKKNLGDDYLNYLSLRADFLEIDKVEAQAEIKKLQQELQKEELKISLKEILKKVKELEKNGYKKALQKTLKEYQNLTNQLSQLNLSKK
jgi:DNA primase